MAETFRVPDIDYTSRDFEALRDDMIAAIPFLTTEWTDFNPSDPGIVILELLAYVGDGLHWYADRTMGEGRLASAVSEKSIRDHLRLIDFVPDSAAASTGVVRFTLSASQTDSAEFVILKGTQVSSGTASSVEVIFETIEDLIFPIGVDTGTIGIQQGVTVGDVAPNGEALGTSSGTPFQKFVFSETPVIEGSERIFVDEGGVATYTEYNQVLTFADELADARIFRLIQGDDGKTSVVFGDNVNGKIPPSNSAIQAAYRKGGGSGGNVGSGTVTVVVSALPGGAVGTVTNSAGTSGGRAAPLIAEMKEQGPLDLRSLRRAVNLPDYKALARKVPGVVTAAAEFVTDEQLVRVAVSDQNGNSNATVMALVDTALRPNDVLGTGLSVIAPLTIPIDCDMTVVVKSTTSRETATALVDAALDAYFFVGIAEGQADFDKSVFLSDWCALIDNLDGVDYVDVTKLTRRPTQNLDNWQATDAVISLAVGSDNTVEQELTFTLASQITQGSAVTYTVTGSVSGPLSTSGSAVFDDGTGGNAVALSLTGVGVDITASILFGQVGVGIPAVPKDTLKVKVGPYNGNQTISGIELRQQGAINRIVTGGTA